MLMKLKLVFIAVFTLLSCNNQKKDTVTQVTSEALPENKAIENDIELEIYDYDGLKPLLSKNDGKVHVINFWATWCAPCVKELPYFEQLGSKYKDKNVEVLLVSLDFPHQYESKLKPFIKERDLKSKVVVLDDPDSNRWIPQINQDWSGSIPATIIINDEKSSFYEQSFNYGELEEALKKFLN